ncbi:hypothetical protein GCM10009106_05420 [Sphingomonas japonica]
MRAAGALALAAAVSAPGAQAQTLLDRCVAQTCKARLTPDQLLGEVQALIAAKRFDEARPMLAALQQLPDRRFETRYLTGMLAAETGDHATAIAQYQAILADDPGQTRVRLELGKAMLLSGRPQSADRQFAIAQQDADLPPDVARTIRTVRDVIRSQRAWSFDFSAGIAPDTNINNATSADQITVDFGGIPIPLELDDAARARSGTGLTATASAGLRLPIAKATTMLVDLDATGTNYDGADYDDYQLQAAAGPEVRLSPKSSVSVQAVGAQRWFGGDVVSRQFGTRIGMQHGIGTRGRLGIQLDVRRTDALFDDGYDGTQAGLFATYERAVAPTLVASAGLFGRRDWLDQPAYSSKEGGFTLGLGGAMPLGINFGLSGTVSRAIYDAPIALFSPKPRKDWRYVARATFGNSKIRVLGFSPQIGWTYTRAESSIGFFDATRSRFTFQLARYF